MTNTLTMHNQVTQPVKAGSEEYCVFIEVINGIIQNVILRVEFGQNTSDDTSFFYESCVGISTDTFLVLCLC